MDLVLGIDIGGTNTKLGYVDRQGTCVAEDVMPTRSENPVSVFFQRLHARAAHLGVRLDPVHRLLGVGVGAPNANHRTGMVLSPPNLRWPDVDLRAELAPYFPVPVAVTNDANAAAMGEMRFGAAQGMRDFIVVTLGTGIGSGIVVNGQILCGSTGLAGEMGHVVVEPSGRPCGCGRRGCLETYASATGLRRTTIELLEVRKTPSPLRELPSDELDPKRIFDAAMAEDSIACESFRRVGEILGRALADAVAYTSPEAIFLLGGPTAAGELLFRPARESLEANLLGIYQGSVKLLASGLPAGRAAVLGAGALIWNELDRSPG